MKRRLADFGELWPAEAKLAAEVHTGLDVVISDSVPPEDAPRDLRLRASFIRYLALGGCDACRPSEKGVRVVGAYIVGDGNPRAESQGLDLEGCTLQGDLGLIRCWIPDTLRLLSASLRNLYLNGSHLSAGLEADRLTAKGGVFLRDITSTGEIRLLGADLGGGLSCTGATLIAGKSGRTLSADRLTAKGGVSFRGVKSTGEIRLLGADLGGDLSCTGATVTAGGGVRALSADGLTAQGNVFLRGVTSTGEIRLLGADLGGDLDCTGATLTAGKSGYALKADSLAVKGTFILRAGASIKGRVILVRATVGVLSDDPACWPKTKGDLDLEGFRYGDIIGSAAPVNAPARLKWLALQAPASAGNDFAPQPHEQLARVFRDMGHVEDARAVLIKKERLQREDRRRRLRKALLFEDDYIARVVDRAMDGLVAYGHRPLRAGWWLAAVWLLGLFVFAGAQDAGAIKPNSAFVLRAPEWAACASDYVKPNDTAPPIRWTDDAGYRSQVDCFLAQPEAAAYPRFDAAIYSLDTLLPIVALEMQEFWIPDERSTWARLYLWVHIAAGWFLSLLAVAGFSGLIKSD